MNSKPLSVLVTGSSGFIGTHVVRHLQAAGHRVTGLDHIPPKDLLPEGVSFHVCDIRQGGVARQDVRRRGPSGRAGRCAPVNGPSDGIRNHQRHRQQPIIIHGDGTQRRDLTHVADVARAVELALRWQEAGSAVLNVGTG